VGEGEEPSGTGWTAGKVIGLAVGLIGMIGFGVCSLCGLAMSFQSPDALGVVLMFAVPGLIVAALCFLLVRKMVRSARKSPP
jgi:biotin transporter BioY